MRMLYLVGGSPDALARLPLFARLHNLVMCAKLYGSLGEDPVRPEPEWTTELREDFKETIASFREQFRRESIREESG